MGSMRSLLLQHHRPELTRFCPGRIGPYLYGILWAESIVPTDRLLCGQSRRLQIDDPKEAMPAMDGTKGVQSKSDAPQTTKVGKADFRYGHELFQPPDAGPRYVGSL